MMKTLGLAGGAALCFCMVASAQVTDTARGRALYENHCMVCHTGKVHTRPNRIVLERRDIVEITGRWQEQQNLHWDKQEIEDVAAYLARHIYKIE